MDLKGWNRWIQSYLTGFGLAQIQLIGVEEMILGFSEPNPYPLFGPRNDQNEQKLFFWTKNDQNEQQH